MDKEFAIQNIKPGNEANIVATSIDTLMKLEYYDQEIIKKLLPFLGENLMAREVLDYSDDPGVDVLNTYFVLWEPFIRAKSALLIGLTIEHAEIKEDLSYLMEPLVNMFLCEEEIEQVFSLIALSSIARKQLDNVMPYFPKIVKNLINIIGQAAVPPKAFSLYHSKPFKSQVFESFLDFILAPGFLDKPENMQRLVENNITLAVIQIALTTEAYTPKKPKTLWRMVWLFLRIATEHPQGIKMWDLDHIPKKGIDSCVLMRIALKGPEKAGMVRNAVNAIPEEDRTFERFSALVKDLSK